MDPWLALVSISWVLPAAVEQAGHADSLESSVLQRADAPSERVRSTFASHPNSCAQISSLSELEHTEDTTTCNFRVHDVPEACKTVSLSGGVQARSLVVGDKSGRRDVGYPMPKVGLLGKRPAVSGGREKTQREGLKCKVESDAAEGRVVKTMMVLLAPSLRKGEGSVDNEGASVPRV